MIFSSSLPHSESPKAKAEEAIPSHPHVHSQQASGKCCGLPPPSPMKSPSFPSPLPLAMPTFLLPFLPSPNPPLLFLPFLILSFLHFPLPPSSAQDFVSFSYPNDPSASFLLLGDALDSHGSIALTRDAVNGSAGRFLCRTPVRMLDPVTGLVASFSTSFSFRMKVSNSSEQGGDGMAFLISPDNHTMGGYGEYLGAFTSTPEDPTNWHTVAVEFDTARNDDVKDPSDNHIGLDVTNITSIFYNNATNVGVRLNDGTVITAWIKYDGFLQNLQVRISVDSMEPVEPLVDADIGFSGVFNEFMYVGFSASSEFGGQEHILMSWAFSSWGLASPTPPPESDTRFTGKRFDRHVGMAITLTLLVFLVLGLGFILWRVTRQRRSHASYFRRAKDYYCKPSACAYPQAFTYKELYAATKGFSEKQRLSSENGVGRFFKGVLPDSGSVVAVKRVSKDPQEGLQEFLQQVSLLISIPHRNLVPIQGWCLEKGELMLVYEFMPNESLDKHLFDEQYETLPWSERYHIVTGIAEGLGHLHQGTTCHEPQQADVRELEPRVRQPAHVDDGHQSAPVLHRDVKASNVMLDNNYNARLGDYGLGRLVCRYKKEEAMVLEGTFGYIAPEVVETGKMTTKSDVFSFGITVLEVACGRRPIDGEVVLVDFVWELQRHGSILNAADKRLKGCFDVGEMECLLHLGLLCTSTDSSLRPTMSQIRSILLAESSLPQLPPCPKQPFRQLSSYPSDIRASLQISIDELLSS